MITLAIALLSAAQDQQIDMQPMLVLAQCVTRKATEWAASTEDAKTIVETALESCSVERDDLRKYAIQYSMQSAPELKARERLPLVDGMVDAAERKVRNYGYQAVIKARTPKKP